MQAGTTIISPHPEFRGRELSGVSFETVNDLFTPGTFYLSHRFSDKLSAWFRGIQSLRLRQRLGQGLGRAFCFINSNSELKTCNFNPAVSLRRSPV